MPQQSKRQKQLQALSNEEPLSDREPHPSFSLQTPEDRRLRINQLQRERYRNERINEPPEQKEQRLAARRIR